MTAWKEKKLSEIADIIAGYAFKGSDFSDEGDEIVIKIKDIQEPFITIQGATKVFIKNYSLSRLEKFKIQNGDFALAMTGATIGKIGKYIDSVHAYINQRVAKFEAKEGSDKNFIYYLTQHPNFKSHILNNIDSQSAQGNISATSIGRYQVRIPDVGTQKLIAHIPQSLDSKIINNRITNETLEAIAQAIFKSWFVDFDPVHAKVNALKNGGDEDEARLAAMQAISGKSTEEMAALKDSDPEAYASLATTADAFPSAFTDSPLGPIPEGWKVEKIGDCYNVIMGQSPSGDTYNEEKNGTIFYQGRAEFGWRFPSPRLYTTDPKRMASAGDVLMSVRAPVGDMNIAYDDCCIGRGLSALRHKSGSTSFTYYQLLTIKPELERFNGEGTVFGSINQNDLKNILVTEPSNMVLEFFRKKCEGLDSLIRSLSIENIALEKTRDVLLPKLLSGEIEIKSNIISLKEEILKRALVSCQNKGYVDIEQLCHEEGIAIVSEKAMTSSKAELRYEGRSFTVYVANKKDSYSIAHELAHYVLGEHRQQIEEYGKAARKGEASLSKSEEKEAENLAAQILMPEEFIHRLFDNKSPDEPAIRKYARQLRVSEQALRYRLNNLGYQTSFKDYRKGYQGTV